MEFARSALDFLVCLVKYAVGLISWALVEIVNEVLAIFAWFASLIGLVIPVLNFEVPQIPLEVLSWINWIFPLGYLAQLYTYTLGGFAIYRLLRWWSNRRKVPIQPLR
jgi:hypothetical protein